VWLKNYKKDYFKAKNNNYPSVSCRNNAIKMIITTQVDVDHGNAGITPYDRYQLNYLVIQEK